MDDELHSLPRLLIELRMEHADLDDLIARGGQDATTSQGWYAYSTTDRFRCGSC